MSVSGSAHGTVREIEYAEFVLRLDLSQQILRLDIDQPVGDTEPALLPTLPCSADLLSAAVLAQKAKQVDDTLYAAVELAAQRGLGNFPSKAALFNAWADAALSAGEHGEAAQVLFAACELGGLKTLNLPGDVARSVQEAITQFRNNKVRSLPVGFYSEDNELTRIFSQDRMLMTELADDEAADALARILTTSGLNASYEQVLALAASMTNPPPANRVDVRKRTALEKRSVLLPSRSHETDLGRRLYESRPIPAGFNLADQLIREIQAGTVSLGPRIDSGWYDYQTWALEVLVAPDRAPEHTHLRLTSNYEEHLRELFKALMALTRETHVKQLEVVPLAASAMAKESVRLRVQPELTVEPLPTYYLRRALSYRFIRQVLERAFGPAWRDLPFTAIRSASWSRVDEALDAMEALFHGAHIRACRELGMEHETNALPDRSAAADEAALGRWARQLDQDDELSRDSRMMVPVFYDIQRKQTKVWMFMGWSSRWLDVMFVQPPQLLDVKRKGAAGRVGKLRKIIGKYVDPQVQFGSKEYQVVVPVTAEIYVDRLLDRAEFRSLCDRYKTRSDIIAALQS